MNAQVLVLNQNYEPLNVCNVKRALVMVITGKAEVLEQNGLVLHTIDDDYRAPSVIRLSALIKRPRPQVKLTRREVFIRDGYICQYCGIHTRDLTIDHVMPKSRNGPHTWENLVSACKTCNHRKGGAHGTGGADATAARAVPPARGGVLHDPAQAEPDVPGGVVQIHPWLRAADQLQFALLRGGGLTLRAAPQSRTIPPEALLAT